jgi:serine protease Do
MALIARRRIKNVVVLAAGLLLAALGVYNIVLKATWTLLDDGVFWRPSPTGMVAGRVAAGGPADRAGVRMGDVLLAIDGEEVLSPEQVETSLRHRQSGERVQYALLRESEPGPSW